LAVARGIRASRQRFSESHSSTLTMLVTFDVTIIMKLIMVMMIMTTIDDVNDVDDDIVS